VLGELGHQEHSNERTELSDTGSDPVSCRSHAQGNTSEGRTNVVIFGPNSVNK
jgi:hypothetical protein